MSLEWKHVLLYTLSLGGGGEVLHKLIGLCHGPTNPTRARDIQCYGLEGCSKQKPGHQWNNETLTFFMAWGCWCGDHFVITNWCRYIRMSYASIAHWVFDLSFLVQKSKADQVTLYVWCVVWGLNVSVRACVCACMCPNMTAILPVHTVSVISGPMLFIITQAPANNEASLTSQRMWRLGPIYI